MHAPDTRENVQNSDNEVIQFTITNHTFLNILLTEIRGKSLFFAAFKKINKCKRKTIKKGVLSLEQNLTELNH